MEILNQYLITIGWALTGGIAMAVILPLVLKIFSLINPIDEWQEVKNGNIGVAIILASVIIATAVVIASAIA